MGWSLLGACVEPTQEPGDLPLFWVLLGCGLGSRCVPARGPSLDPGASIWCISEYRSLIYETLLLGYTERLFLSGLTQALEP